MLLKRLTILLLFLPILLFTQNEEEVSVDLREPTYQDGTLKTKKGGVLKTDQMRIQAKEITYIKKENGEWKIHASKNLHIRYHGKNFTGTELEDDFNEKKGIIKKGHTQAGCWYISGEEIELKPHGNYQLKRLDLTTCPGTYSLWKMTLRNAKLEDQDLLSASNATVKLAKVPIFWLPYFRVNLSTLKEIAALYRFNTGGGEGYRLSMRYKIYSWRDLNVFWQLDYWFSRGPSTSLQFDYKAPNHPTKFQANNFVAWNFLNPAPYNIFRNRFVGEFNSKIEDVVKINLQYEKLSDNGVLTDYFNQNYFLQNPRRTQLKVDVMQPYWQAMLRTTVRINEFQSVSQELPIIFFNLRPIQLFNSPLLLTLNSNIGYLDFNYSNAIDNRFNNYRSPRFEFKPKLMLPVHLGPVKLSGYASYVGIGYGQSLKDEAVWNSLANLGASFSISANKIYANNYKHVIRPYVNYQFFSNPTVSFQDHYFFDYNDAYVKLNQMRFGLLNTFYYKNNKGYTLPFNIDVYTYAFYNNITIGSYIPKMYVDFSTHLSNLYTKISFGQNFQHSQIDRFNTFFAYTLSEDFALSLNFMYRSPYDYRKADTENYLLDVFRPQAELLSSPLSDRRNVLQTKVYWRVLRDVILEFESRSGWNRKNMPAYNEYWINVTFLLPCNWRFTFSPYRSVSAGWQFLWKIYLGGEPPRKKSEPYIFW